MQVYLDITLLPSDDIGLHFLWEKVFQQVHLALVENKNAEGHSSFGIYFPEFSAEKPRLGRKLRIFAPDEFSFSNLAIARWLERLTDYVHITSVKTVPADIKGMVSVGRLTTKSNVERLARRAAKRQGITFEEAMAERENVKPVHTRAPYIWVKSLSGGERFRLFVSQQRNEQQDKEVHDHHFSLYGLAKNGCLPHF